MDNVLISRRTELMKKAAEANNQHLLILDPANVFYYTGFLSEPHERFMGLYINLEKEEMHFFVPALDETAAAKASDVASIIPISDEESPYDMIKQTVKTMSGNIGIEGTALQYKQYIELTKRFSNLAFVDVESLIVDQRLQKSTDEVKKIQYAIDLIEDVLEQGVKKIKPGMTESQLTAELEYLMRTCGADGPSFSTIVLTGENAALPHGVPGDTKIKHGDLLLIDFGVIKDGYCSDITRTFAVGEPSEKHKELYNIVLAANEAGIAAVKAGEPLKNFDIAARKVIEDAGYGDYYHNRVGHGMGIEVHEAPSVHGANEDKAIPGMVFTIEPGIYLPGEVGIRIEDNIYINEDGTCEVLTSFPKQLQVL
ncbi:MAG TPA: Xaa-Pro peptidase family protein [Bacillota bacterium]|nr:Xaa-Pro peptidase family protein [Bacillota bacterium]